MSFTLRVRFCGMCVFVRDGTSRMHVLLPATGGTFPVDPAQLEGTQASGCGTCTDAGMTIEPHTARIALDTAHLHPGRTELDGYLTEVTLRDRVLAVPAYGGGLNPELPPELVSVGGTVRTDVFGDAPGSVLTARVSFESGSCTGVAAGGCWSWRGSVSRMTHVVEWSVPDVPGEELTLPLEQFAGAWAGDLGPFYPVNGVLDLEVWHVPYSDLPPDPVIAPPLDPSTNVVAHHFAAMLRLFQDPSYELPLYLGDECPRSAWVNEDLDELHKGLAVLTCVGSQA